jgi:CubicO group peptidase (beta-lactamase class C family)
LILRNVIWLGLIAVIGAVFTGLRFYPAVRTTTALAAHDICSKTFISGFDPQIVFDEIVTRPGVSRLKPALRYEVDWSNKVVSSSFAGWVSSSAAFHDRIGCVVLHEPAEPYLPKINITKLKALGTSSLLAEPSTMEPSDVKLKAALDHAFEEPAVPPYRKTNAVVVVLDGKIIAERYAPGVGVDTPLLGFSLTKSVVNAMIGILVQQGRLRPSQTAPIAQWQGANPRHVITIEQLMRMTTGLADDDQTSNQMFYLHNDMAAFAANAKIVAAPGTRWAYSSRSTQLLARIIRDTVGGPEQTLEFAWRELFNPVGMRNVTLEFDGTGTLQGASNMFASARDWARFGLLYLNDGTIGSRRLLPDGWIKFSAKATLDTDYGAGFWTARSERERAEGPFNSAISSFSSAIPHNAFYALGNLGQIIVVLPSQRLVIVRLGDSVDVDGEMRNHAYLVTEIIAGIGR